MRIGDIFTFTLVVVLLVLLSPVIVPLMFVLYLKERIDRVGFSRFLTANEGAKYFAYTDKQSSQSYVERQIVPFLDEDVKVIYLGGTKGRLNLGEDHRFFNRIVWAMKTTGGGFPYMAKVVDGHLLARSINNPLYNSIKRGSDSSKVLSELGKFFADRQGH